MKAWVIQNKNTGAFVSIDELNYTKDICSARLWPTRRAARESRYWDTRWETVKKVNVEVTLA